MTATRICGLDAATHQAICVAVEEGHIARVYAADQPTDVFLSPGFIDLQVNGYAGCDLNDEALSPETVRRLLDAQLAHGVTSFVPTLISAAEEKLCQALAVIAKARDMDCRLAAAVPFVHVEGPHLSPLAGFRGAHRAEDIRPPSIAEFERWQQACGGLVGMVTLSPHFDNAEHYIWWLVERGVHVALGHTHASAELVCKAVDAGASLSTHLGNGIAEELHRHRNPIWPQLAEDRLTATFIGDGHHLPPYVLQSMLRAKGISRSILVSDSVALAGMPPDVYTTPVGGKVELRSDGKLCVFGSDLLAGSTANLAECIGAVVRMTGIPLHAALAMSTVNPGRFVGGRGRLDPGCRADLVRFRWQERIVVEDVWVGGECVFSRSQSVREETR